jgi:acyl-CoA synthetase (AMP-forming)/AMP-acid ligase II
LLAQPKKPEETQHSLRMMYGLGFRKEFWKEFKTRFVIRNICEFYGATESNIFLRMFHRIRAFRL